MNINSQGQRPCCGCTVCPTACPQECIKLVLDADGYYTAIADDAACIQCGKCVEVCYKFQNFEDEPTKVLQSFVGFNKNDKVRLPSSSGGIGSALAEAAIDSGYCVVGAELDLNARRVKHVIIDSKEDIPRIRGSKYFPSYTTDAFSALQERDKALIIALPCQISALRKIYADKKEFIYVDLKCFGPMGYNILDKYISFLSGINSSGIKSLNFRDKSVSWKAWGPRVEFLDGKVYHKMAFRDPWGLIFNTFLAVHQVCLSCDHYKNVSEADIRLEDAWHKMEFVTGEGWKKGVSQITIYTEKGREFFQKTQRGLAVVPTSPTVWTPKHRKEPVALMQLLRDDQKDIVTVVNEYKKTLPVKKRIMGLLGNYVAMNRKFYLFAYNMYHNFVKKTRKKN